MMTQNFYFIRHGETDWNRQKILQGQIDIPLNDCGIAQAHSAASLLKDKGIASIVSSPLKRALKTAEIIAQIISCPIKIVDDLKEVSLGIMEGKPKAEWFWSTEWRNGNYCIDGAETFATFADRVMRGFNQAISLPGPVLIVAHGGVYRTLSQAFSLSPDSLHNCVPVYHSIESKDQS